ncbi:MAG TPA: GDSL-type esterase/lipase family protein [Actinomycetes bacterium]|nr:GDSL-type esterase/lipase family protein [Actinomycetes bacterium]
MTRGSLLLVGDSHLAETTTRDVAPVAARLRRLGWELTSLAVGGLDTRAARRLLPDPLPATDATVVSFGSNDAAPWKQVPLAEFTIWYAELLARIASPVTVVMGPPPVREDRDDPRGRTNAVLDDYAAAALQVAESSGVRFLDLREVLDPATDLDEDGLHLADSGARAAAAALDGALRG